MELLTQIKRAPNKPGVYFFKNQRGDVLYIGKAKNLKKRLLQYLGKDNRPQIPQLLGLTANIDYTVVNSELESLFLENTLIKQHLPPYNIKLRDDKNYAFIKIDYTTQIPQIDYHRQVNRNEKNIRYFGPYSSVKKIQGILSLARKIFPYCSAKKIGNRPCFYYHLHRCPGICIGRVSLKEYHAQLNHIALFLSGKTTEIKTELKKAMRQASQNKNYETAARLRDRLQSLTILSEKQATIFTARVSWDVISTALSSTEACINIFKIREGKLLDKENFIYAINLNNNTASVLQTFAEQYYRDASDIPKAIILESVPENESLIQALLKTRTHKVVTIFIPKRGRKIKLVKLGQVNAIEYLNRWQTSQASHADILNQALEGLKKLLNLPQPPKRIEAYDISNTQGTNPVGSMVVFVAGQPAKQEYRKFKINKKQTPDDFAMMAEMLDRRLTHNQAATMRPWPMPELIVIDGGKGQLSVAMKILKQYKLNIPTIGLAKRIEEVFVPGNSKPIILPHSHPVLQLLQRLRDEAHRFAITFHRSLRSKQATKSVFDTIPGIGPKTKKVLKQKFGTATNVRQASIEDLAKIVGIHKAQVIKNYL